MPGRRRRGSEQLKLFPGRGVHVTRTGEILEIAYEDGHRVRIDSRDRVSVRYEAQRMVSAGVATRIEVAGLFGYHPETIGEWVRRYEEGGMRGLFDRPRRRRAPKQQRYLPRVKAILRQEPGLPATQVLQRLGPDADICIGTLRKLLRRLRG
jgi:transposase